MRHIDLIPIKQQNNSYFQKDMQVFVDFIAAFASMKRNILLQRSFTSALLSFNEWIAINESHFRLIKYADDLALVGLLPNDLVLH